VRILHAVTHMRRAGLETWLMHVLRRIDRERFQMDFLVHRDEPGDYDEEIRSLGSNVLYGAPLRQVWSYSQTTNRLLRRLPRYDIFHAHLDHFSGYPLKCAAEVGIPVRIAHCHSDVRQSFSKLRWSLKLYVKRSRLLTAGHRTLGLATSDKAGESMFGRDRTRRPWSALPCGIDLAPYSYHEQHDGPRQEFGIAHDAVIVGHVGRFVEEKNHRLILDVAECMLRRSGRFHFVLVGDGPLRRRIEEDVARRGLASCVSFAGVRADVPRLFSSLFDVFLFPSQSEGLGLVLVESQAACCPAVISDVVPPEAEVVSRLITRLSLGSPAELWADAVFLAARKPRSDADRIAAYQSVANSPLNISVCVEHLTSLYLREVSRRKAA
jgi:glycosyltransferase involved in cell wall biosynthesis